MSRRVVTMAALAAALAACQSGPGVELANDKFQSCDDEVAMAAFVEAQELVGEGELEHALTALRGVVETCRDFVPAHVLFQDVAAELGGEHVESVRSFYAAWPDDPSSPLLPYLLSRLTDEPSERIPRLEEAIARDRSFYYAYLDKARVLRSIRRTDEALDALEYAVTAAPQCPHSNKELAEVLVGLGRAREAADHYAAYLALEPGDDGARREFVRLLVYSLGRTAEAEPLLDDLLDGAPDDTSLLMDKAAVAWLRGDFDAACDAYRRVLEIDPSEDRAVLNLGNLYFEPLARTEAERERAWPKARAAYRYYLAMERDEQPEGDVFDALDARVFVPYRLDEIAKALGPAPPNAPRLGDF